MAPSRKGSASARSRSATPAKDADAGTPRPGTLLAFFSPSPSPGPAAAPGKRRLSDASTTSTRSSKARNLREVDGGEAVKRSRAKGKGKAVDAGPSVIDLCESPPASPTRHASPKSSARKAHTKAPSVAEDGNDDVFAIPFAPAADTGRAKDPFDVPKEGDDYIRPPELADGETDDLWEVESIASESTCGRSVASEWISSDDEAVGTAAGPSSRAEGPPKCPICGTNLSGLVITDAQNHVNACLDGDASRTSPSADPSLRELKPLTEHIKAFAAPLHKPKGKAKVQAEVKNPDAFTALMMGHAEDKAWKVAEKDLQRPRPGAPRFVGKRQAPFYKIIEGMPIAVDAFRYGAIPNVKFYALSHHHSDHYVGLTEKWNHGPIFSSVTTANLMAHSLGVARKWLRPLKNDEPTPIGDGITVTCLDANHCPGSSMFLFEGPHTLPSSPYSKTPSRIFRYLHCGDFRASPEQLRHPVLRGKKIDIVYLDTTYLNPKYCFPAQEQVINACAELVRDRVQGDEGALRRGRGGDGSMERAEKMMAGWLDSSAVKREGSVKKEEPREAVKQETGVEGVKPEEISGDVKEEPRVSEIDDEPAQMAKTEDGVADDEDSYGQEDEDEKMAWEAMEVGPEGGDERPPSIDPAQFLPKPPSQVDGDVKPELKPNARGERFCVLVGTYSIGKERIVKGIAHAIGSKVYCNAHKAAIFRCIEDPELHALLTDDPREATVHVTNLFAIKRETLEDYLESFGGHFTKIIGLRPTGWTFKSEGPEDKLPSIAKTLARDSKRGFSPAYLYPQRDSTERCQAYGVPYSEHSSFFELTCFCLSFDWVRIIPTVNCGNPTSRAKMRVWFERWHSERKRRKENREPLFIEPRADSYW